MPGRHSLDLFQQILGSRCFLVDIVPVRVNDAFLLSHFYSLRALLFRFEMMNSLAEVNLISSRCTCNTARMSTGNGRAPTETIQRDAKWLSDRRLARVDKWLGWRVRRSRWERTCKFTNMKMEETKVFLRSRASVSVQFALFDLHTHTHHTPPAITEFQTLINDLNKLSHNLVFVKLH